MAAFAPAVPGTWSRSRVYLDLATHEAGHAVAGYLLGLPVRETRIDRPADGDADGVTRIDVSADREAVRKRIAVLMAGSLSLGRPIPWRGLNGPPASIDDDEGVAHALAFYADVGEDEWYRIADATLTLLNLRGTRRAIRAVARALLERGALSGGEIRAIVEASRA